MQICKLTRCNLLLLKRQISVSIFGTFFSEREEKFKLDVPRSKFEQKDKLIKCGQEESFLRINYIDASDDASKQRDIIEIDLFVTVLSRI